MVPISAFFDLDSFANALFLASRKILDSIISVRITSLLELTASWQKGESSFTKILDLQDEQELQVDTYLSLELCPYTPSMKQANHTIL